MIIIELKALFSQGKIGSVKIKNRIVRSATYTGSAENGYVTNSLIKYYTDIAEGEIGLIITGIVWWSFPWALVTIFAGLILAFGILPAIPALGKHLEKLAKWLGGFQTIIGLIVLIIGILGVIGYF